MRQELQLVTFLILTALPTVSSQVPSSYSWLYNVGDPCVNHTVITNAAWRSTSNTRPFTDDYWWIWTGTRLSSGGWFRFDNSTSGVLSTICPTLPWSCGAPHPVYVASPLPKPYQGISNVTVYTDPWVTRGWTCGNGTVIGSIPVKNCNGFYAYGLIPLIHFNTTVAWSWGSYCIDNNATACPGGTFADDGHGTACLPLLPNITQTADITPVLPQWALEFRCATNTTGNVVMSQNQTLEVEWLSSKFNLLHKETIVFSQNLNVFHLNSTHNWIRPYGNLGQKISCRVRVFESYGNETTAYTPWVSSPQFYAGLEVSNSTLRVQSNSSSTIYFRSTVPVNSLASEKVYVSIPKYQSSKVWQVCGDKSLLILEDKSCGIEVQTANTWIPLIVHAKEVQPFAGLQLTKIHLRTGVSPLNPFFSNSSALDISVTVIPPPSPFTISGKCTMRADPHVKTFDNYYYDHQMAGEYVIVDDKATDIQVNGFFQATAGQWFSLCGIALRSAGDVFIYSKCSSTKLSISVPNGPPKVVVETRGCNVGGISYSEGDRFFEVRLPNGMVIKGINRYWNYHHFDLEITAKEPSYGSLYGLCGTFDGAPANDLLHSDLQTISNRQPRQFSAHLSFSQSWSVNATDSLFKDNTSFNTTHKTPIFCSCADPDSQTLVNETECGAAQVKQTCEYTTNLHDVTDKLYQRCSVPQSVFGRRKRAADLYMQQDGNEDVNRVKRQAFSPTTSSGSVLGTDYDNEAFDEPFLDPAWTFPAPQWINGWNDTKARTLCSSKLSQTRTSVAASVPGINVTTYLEQCVYDIKISGGNEFVDPLVDTIIEDARNAMQYDTSLWLVVNGVLQPDFTILNQLCPDDCSGNGACVEGSCVCSGSYFGESCARSRQDPPVVTGVAWGGLCDSSLRPCQAVAVFGDNFVYNSSAAACLVQEFEMDEHGTILATHAAVSTTIDLTTRYKAYCDLPTTNRGKRSSHTSIVVHGYNITVTNNGTYYSTGVTVFVADSRCLECNATTTTCSIKNNTCLVNKQCYLHNETDFANSCLECDPATNKFNFTLDASSCYIGGQCFSSGYMYNSTSNLHCDPAADQYSWTPKNAFTNLLTEEGSSFVSKHWWIFAVLGLIAVGVAIGFVIRLKKSSGKKVDESTKQTRDTYRSTSSNKHKSFEASRPASPEAPSFSQANKPSSSAKHELHGTHAPSSPAQHSPSKHDVAPSTSQTWKSCRTNNAFGELDEPTPTDKKDDEFDLGRMTPNPTRYQKADRNVLKQIVGSLFARRK